MRRTKQLINDPLAPTKIRIKLPSGKIKTLKRKKAYDKGRFDTQMRQQYLELISEGITNKDAAKACGCGTRYFKRRRDEMPDFAADYQRARGDGDDMIRAEIKRRAVDGIRQGIYHDGKRIATKTVYSDQLLMFLAKSRMEEFKDNQHEITHTHKLEGAAEQLASKIAQVLGLPEPDTEVISIIDRRGGDDTEV